MQISDVVLIDLLGVRFDVPGIASNLIIVVE